MNSPSLRGDIVDRRRKSIIALTVLGLAVYFAALMVASSIWNDDENPSLQGTKSGSLAMAGGTRTYLIHVPPNYDGKKPLPLVLVLHGGGGGGQSAEKMTGMSAKADKENFLVAYPNGDGILESHLLTWNSGNCCGYAQKHNIDDTAFLRVLIDKLERDYAVDSKRVYATGISNGGMMSHRLACEAADKIAAVGPVAGALNLDCRPSAPVSIIAIHGTADQNVLYDGGIGKNQFGPARDDRPVAYAISFWVKEDGCAPAPQRNENSVLRTDIYADCRNGTGVALYTVVGGGHAWPGGDRLAHFLDAPNPNVPATDLIWSFFVAHPKQ
jgi:polyhydroxybutyrate depolymerase